MTGYRPGFRLTALTGISVRGVGHVSGLVGPLGAGGRLPRLLFVRGMMGSFPSTRSRMC